MRGFTKAAALLTFTRALSLVVPDPATLTAPLSNPIVKYHPQDTSLTFDIDTVTTNERLPTFTFQVQGTSSACGESHIILNGLRLDSVWDGVNARGRKYLDIYGGTEAEWHISCTFDTVPADGQNSNGEDVIHVLSLRVGSSLSSDPSGFTISYKQLGDPAILRFKPQYQSSKIANLPENVRLWRTPSLEINPKALEGAKKDALSTSLESIGRAQKSLGGYFQALKGCVQREVEEVIERFCPKHRAQAEKAEALRLSSIPSDRLLEAPPPDYDQTTTKTDTSDSTYTVPNLSAAETRSLTALQSFEPSAIPTSAPVPSPHSDYNLHLLKLFALVLTLSSCFAWICLRCRDPRRRAECLARREERRNKKLYRRAARQHMVRMWFWNFRLKYGLVPDEVLEWDEKRTRIVNQEIILEDAMTDDIRALRNAHRVVSTVTAAEEGRNGFVYDSEESERRQSVTTLPGYESEGSQPPTYEDSGSRRLDGPVVVDGFRYAAAETEFRSDSSVISTSPRMSRDGTSSDFDEKFEAISLGATEPAGSGL